MSAGSEAQPSPPSAATAFCTRRRFLQRVGMVAAAGVMAEPLTGAHIPASTLGSGPFRQRGYYITFMRMPTYGLAAWKRTLHLLAADDINLLILWVGGGFRSKKFPVTWRFNAEHENVRNDFLRRLIEYAHELGIEVLLGFTPFGYDGVNQYSRQHPELKALKPDGRPADEFGIYSWGWNLCPSRAASQKFMLEYAREMFFEFYPNADGVLIESSDYAICHCPECQGHFFEREFEFVERFSNEIWQRRRDARIVVYPHYFPGTRVPGFNVTAAARPFDPRWTLFFTPHSAHADPTLIAKARSSLWSDDAPALRDPAAIQRGAQHAARAGITGYVPSLEAFSYIPTHPEEGQSYLVGKRQVPFGFGWLKPDEMPYGELPVRVNRIAFREHCRQPDLTPEEFRRRLAAEVFDDVGAAADVDDLLLLHRVFTDGRTWCQPALLVSPERVRLLRDQDKLDPEQLAAYRSTLERVDTAVNRLAQAQRRGTVRNELRMRLNWVRQLWSGPNARLLAAG